MLNVTLKLARRPTRLPSRRDPLDGHEKPGYRPRPRVPYYSKPEQLEKNFRRNCLGIILQTKMFVACIGTLDLKSVDPVLKGVAGKVVLTIRRQNTLNRVPAGSWDVYE